MAEQSLSDRKRVYMDNAATSWPKSDAVLAAVFDYMQNCGATAGRGSYRSALVADQWLSRARVSLAKLINAKPHEIAICSSGTHALNAALHGVLRPGARIVTCSLEHNSLLRPVENMRQRMDLDVEILPAEADGRAAISAWQVQVTSKTDWLSVGHASNVTGAVNSLEDWGGRTKEVGAKFLVDASQTLGYLPIDVQAAGVDVLAAATHKGLGGLAGTGMLYVREELHEHFLPLILGGTGRSSNEVAAKPVWPEAVEVGNLNLPGVVSIAVAAEELVDINLLERWMPSFSRLVEGLTKIDALRIVGGSPVATTLPRVPVVSVVAEGWDVHDLASLLDASFQIEARAGWHCAALIHKDVASEDSGGTLRLSTGRRTTVDEVDYVVSCLREVLT